MPNTASFSALVEFRPVRFTPGRVRLSVGLGTLEDLIWDLERALEEVCGGYRHPVMRAVRPVALAFASHRTK